MLKILPGETLVCEECDTKATYEDYEADNVRMYMHNGAILCECCKEDLEDRNED